MKLYTVNETIYNPNKGISTKNLITTLSWREAMRVFDDRLFEAEKYNPIWNDPDCHIHYEAEGIYYDIKSESVSVDVPTTFDELSEAKVTSRQIQSAKFLSPFEKRLNKQVCSVWSSRQVEGSKTEATANMIYNSGEFIIVFQCDDRSRTVATSIPYEAESYNQITDAIRNFIKNCY